MVDMDEAIRELAIRDAEIKIAHYACRSVTLDTEPPGSWVALEPIDKALLNRALRISLTLCQLAGFELEIGAGGWTPPPQPEAPALLFPLRQFA